MRSRACCSGSKERTASVSELRIETFFTFAGRTIGPDVRPEKAVRPARKSAKPPRSRRSVSVFARARPSVSPVNMWCIVGCDPDVGGALAVITGHDVGSIQTARIFECPTKTEMVNHRQRKFCFISERYTPVRLSRRARSLARSLPHRALKSRFLRPRHLHLIPPPPGVVPPSTESSSSEVPSSDDSPAPETGSAPCATSARVSSSEEGCRRSARAAAHFTRALQAGPTVMRLATARAANCDEAKLRSEEESGRSGRSGRSG